MCVSPHKARCCVYTRRHSHSDFLKYHQNTLCLYSKHINRLVMFWWWLGSWYTNSETLYGRNPLESQNSEFSTRNMYTRDHQYIGADVCYHIFHRPTISMRSSHYCQPHIAFSPLCSPCITTTILAYIEQATHCAATQKHSSLAFSGKLIYIIFVTFWYRETPYGSFTTTHTKIRITNSHTK